MLHRLNSLLMIEWSSLLRGIGAGMLFARAFIDGAHYPWELTLTGFFFLAIGGGICMTRRDIGQKTVTGPPVAPSHL
jgi:hypothetical protein